MNYEMRIPGFGGAGVFLRRTVAGSPATAKALDLWLVGPSFCNAIFRRATEPGLLADLAKYLFTVAGATNPTHDMPSFQDSTAGLSVDVVTSDERRIGLQVNVVEDLEADVTEYLGLNFETSRAALANSASKIAETFGTDNLADFGGFDG